MQGNCQIKKSNIKNNKKRSTKSFVFADEGKQTKVNSEHKK